MVQGWPRDWPLFFRREDLSTRRAFSQTTFSFESKLFSCIGKMACANKLGLLVSNVVLLDAQSRVSYRYRAAAGDVMQGTCVKSFASLCG